MNKIAFLYAGQGSQFVGMGAEFYEQCPEFRPFYDNAPVDFDLKELCLTDKEGKLSQTMYTQPCMVSFACGVTHLLKKQGIVPDFTAGLSLGEYSALTCADVFDSKTAVQLVAKRGALMAQAASKTAGAMVAVLGADSQTVEQICQKASRGDEVVSPANYNCPGQIVIGGTAGAVGSAVCELKAAGVKRCIALDVSGAFHTPLMAQAAEQFAEVLEATSFSNMSMPVLFNCLGRQKSESDSISDLLTRQITAPVKMEQIITQLKAEGVTLAVEIGPGKALSGFVKKTAPEIETFAVQTPEQMDELVKRLKG